MFAFTPVDGSLYVADSIVKVIPGSNELKKRRYKGKITVVFRITVIDYDFSLIGVKQKRRS